MKDIERQDNLENQEKRREDVKIAENIGLGIIEGLPAINEVRNINFQEAGLDITYDAWSRCRNAFDLLRNYYDRFPNKSPYANRFEEQPYSRFESWLSDWDQQRTYFTHSRDSAYWLQMFQHIPHDLVDLLSIEFNLPPLQTLSQASGKDELLQILSAPPTESGITGVRFLPIFRKVLGLHGEPDKDEKKEYAPFLLWNPDDPPEMIRIGKNKNSHYFIGATENVYDLESTLKDYIIAPNVIELPRTSSADLVPVLDVDGTLVEGRSSRDPLTDAAKRLLNFFNDQNRPYGLWSRSDGPRLRWLSEEINKAIGTKPEFMVSFDNWPFLEKNTSRINPHSLQEIRRVVEEHLLSRELNYSNLGYESAEEMCEGLYDIFHSPNTHPEIILQCKNPRHIPFSPDARNSLTPDTETRLLNNQGVLIDDRIASFTSAVRLGFNFVHVDFENRVDRVAKFF